MLHIKICTNSPEIYCIVSTLKATFISDLYLKSHRTNVQVKKLCWVLQIKYTAKRGFYLFIRPDSNARSEAQTLPSNFIALQSKGTKKADWTTHELMALNARLQSASQDCLVLTFQVIIDFLINSILLSPLVQGADGPMISITEFIILFASHLPASWIGILNNFELSVSLEGPWHASRLSLKLHCAAGSYHNL